MLTLLALALADAPPPVVNGYETTNYPEAGLILLRDRSGNVFGYCTATAVHARSLLTAAHCLDGDVTAIGSVQVTFERDYAEARRGDWTEATAWALHPDFDATTLTDDLAVIHFDEDLAAPVMQLAQAAPSERDVGQNFRLVGYGLTSGDAETDPVRRAADVPMSDFTDNWLWLLDKRDHRNACFGDSGGPVLRVYDDGSYAQASVTSWITTCDDGGTASTRLDNALAFLADEGIPYTLYGDAPPSYPAADEDLDPEDDDPYVDTYGLGGDDEASCGHAGGVGGWLATIAAVSVGGRRRWALRAARCTGR